MTERRAVERAPITTACRASFEFRGQERKALMIDLSTRGAGFLVYQSAPFGMAPGELLAIEVVTPMGASRFVGRVVWQDQVTAGVRFGVEFAEIDAGDPLLAYADSPF
jgi:hypothetical protein